MEQVKHWLKFWSAHPELHDRVRTGWTAVLRRLINSKARSRWRWATGPMGAIILALGDLGWVPRAPDRWIDASGDEWQYDADNPHNYDEISTAIRASCRKD
eukprot:6994259-Pyramimonas_sp.AAC.1